MNALSEIGQRGLIIYDGTSYFIVKEADWRKLDSYGLTGDKAVPSLVELQATVAALGDKSASVFVDLERLSELAETEGSKATKKAMPKTAIPKIQGNNIVLREGSSVFVVPREKWEPLNPGLSGDASVLVNRGAVVAAIPPNHIPQGTFCVFINLAGLGKTG